MTPKEKAKDLVHKYITLTDGWVYGKENWEHKKKCALIAVDEIMYALSVPPIQNKGHLLYDGQIDYWQQVKQEIEKL